MYAHTHVLFLSSLFSSFSELKPHEFQIEELTNRAYKKVHSLYNYTIGLQNNFILYMWFVTIFYTTTYCEHIWINKHFSKYIQNKQM